ncbi:DapH/DapD/GlmU-related protein [Halobacterium zhouii]|uniref:acyltransferase n=1 Tax=Halobacterium zhouii TaxID=2902624 RepID=UPI003D7BA402
MTDATVGADGVIQAGVTLGDPDGQSRGEPPVIGRNATIRSGTVIYPNVVVGDNFVTGHDALVREDTTIGDDVVVGTQTVVDGDTSVGDRVSMQTGVYVPTNTTIERDVFLGPNATLTNDPHPLREECELVGPTLEHDVSVGANATLLPDVTVGERSFVAAGAVVTEDVPPETLAVGTPAEFESLPGPLDAPNR